MRIKKIIEINSPISFPLIPLSQTGPRLASKLQTRSSGSPTARRSSAPSTVCLSGTPAPAMSLVKCSQERARAAGPTDGKARMRKWLGGFEINRLLNYS